MKPTKTKHSLLTDTQLVSLYNKRLKTKDILHPETKSIWNELLSRNVGFTPGRPLTHRKGTEK